ncbi:MAG: helix-hairpin-helix domain-containing protein [Defluviitaleaceae bacterium]|nr:helix-hairpin-helix domain-containing protein [Defluviitaleaceae bacterium]
MYIDKNKIYIGLAVLAVIVAGFIYVAFFANRSQPTLTLTPTPYTPNTIAETTEDEIEEHYEILLQPANPTSIVVFISGEVNYPKVLELEYGSRVIDALEMAGGATPYADLNRINLASFVLDEQHIVIPAIGQELEVVGTAQPSTTAVGAGGLVNINTADLQTLTTLPGIGPVIGQSIINYREQNGHFSSIEQIQNVTRIGPAIFRNIRELITV